MIAYDSVIPMASDALKASVLLETSYTAVSFPTVLLPVHSYIGDMMEQEAPDAIEEYIRIVHQIKNSLAPTAEDIHFSISAEKGFQSVCAETGMETVYGG